MILLSVIILAVAVQAQADTLRLNLRQAIDTALARNQTVLLDAKEALASSDASYTIARAQYRPKLDLALKESRSLTTDTHEGGLTLTQSNLLPTGGTVSLTGNYQASGSFAKDPGDLSTSYKPQISLSLSQPLSPVEIRRKRQILKEMDRTWEQAMITYTSAIENFIIQIIGSYSSLLKSIRSLERSRIRLEQSVRMLDIARLKLKAGTVPELEVMNLEVQQAIDRDNVLQEENSLSKEKEAFFILLGVGKNREIALDPRVEIKPVEMTMEQCIQEALANRYELKQAEISIYLSNLSVLESRMGNLPTANLAASSSWDKSAPTFSESVQSPPKRDWSVSLSLNMPILDGGAYGAKLTQAKGSHRLNVRNYEEMKKNIVTETREIYNDLIMNQKRLESFAGNIETARNAVTVAEMKFKQGMISQEEVSRTRDRLAEVEQSFDDARFSYVLLESKLLKAIGKLSMVRQAHHEKEKNIENHK